MSPPSSSNLNLQIANATRELSSTIKVLSKSDALGKKEVDAINRVLMKILTCISSMAETKLDRKKP